MLRIFMPVGKRGWKELENGPFPLTGAQLESSRTAFARELEASGPLSGARMSPQTAARDILRTEAPALNDFDRLMVGFAVSCDRVRYEAL